MLCGRHQQGPFYGYNGRTLRAHGDFEGREYEGTGRAMRLGEIWLGTIEGQRLVVVNDMLPAQRIYTIRGNGSPSE